MDTLQLVDSVSGTATVRLDLNDATTWQVAYEGTDFTPPPLRRTVSSSMLTDGATITASAYDNRAVTLQLELITSTVDGQGTEIQKLNRELDREMNYLKWQPAGATSAVFFRLFRSDYGAIREVPGSGKYRTMQVRLVAEPFALGLAEAPGTFTVNNDPAAGTNPCWFDLTGIKGDVETPLYMSVNDPDFQSASIALATRRRGTPSAVTWFRQAEGASLGTDTTLPGNDPLASGSGSNYARTSFSTTPANTARLTLTLPAAGTGSVDWKGTYRVLVRARRSASDPVKIQLSYGSTANAQVSVTSTAFITYDLGLLQIPAFNVGNTDGYGGEWPAAGQFVQIKAERTSGTTSNLDWDYVFLVPADQECALMRTSNALASTVIDGPNRAVYSVGAGELVTNSVGSAQASWDGSLPMLTPGQTNRIFVVNGLPGSAPALGSSAAFVTKYWPRYLYVRPATT